ncbi:hypothetical protein DB88DRAFT_508602 [Papiliotrema laurentii]|uniref:Rhodanese domain-containing protein n=1 Tax=Papiliotrema laurentii TaxID=5418 RepID=A0AAD9FUG1_PAPLA|nr:hypothetical protein DB88DRAFT_508602 [Papiliotrema laurentii]
MTRYLLSDASVLLDKPLVSGAAISTAGQWAVYGGTSPSGSRRACYRCMWPRVVGDGGGRCDEIGVWGPVVGLVGVAMAGEALRLVLGSEERQQSLHLYHMGGDPLVRTVKIRPPSVKCIACGPNRTIDKLEDYDYETFCSGPTSGDGFVGGTDRISAKEFAQSIGEAQGEGKERKSIIVDTRPPVEYEICSLPNTINIPFDKILKDPTQIPNADETIFICRRGNDSLLAARALRASLEERGQQGEVKDVMGGLVAWARDVDPDFPVY